MSTVVDLKTKEEKDAELDRRIEALRKKNEALVRRYQEIEEDKKKAEQDGVAVMPARKPRPHEPEGDRRKTTEKENFTVTVDLSKPAGEKRVINDWKQGPPRGRRTPEEGDGGGFRPEPGSDSPPRRAGSGRLGRGGQRGGGGPRQEKREPREYNAADPRPDRLPMEGEAGEAPGRSERGRRGGGGRRGGRGGGVGQDGGRGRGGGGGGGGPTQDGSGTDRKSKEWEEKRRQNIEKMNEEMEKIAEYERGQRADGDKPIRNFLDDPRRSGPAPDIDRKDGSRRHVRNWGGLDFDKVKTSAEQEKEWTSRRPGGGPKGSWDMTVSMTGRERAEYLRWKKEREQIDEARLARHRNATGQWRREWDAQKTDTMFKENPDVAGEGGPEQGSRRDDNRPSKGTTFGDFLGQGRDKPREGGHGERGRGRGRPQSKSYSMHDNRWEGEKEDEGKEREKHEGKEREKHDEDKIKTEKTPKKKEERKTKSQSSNKAEEKSSDGEEDEEDEWEDASDGEDEETEGDSDSEGGEEEKNAKSPKETPRPKADRKSPASPPLPSAASREQRSPRLPKVHIPDQTQASPEGGGTKPLSPFPPLDGHQPVSDWGEEMEMQSPRSSLGESPLKPLSAGNSPAQDKEGKKPQEDSLVSSPAQDKQGKKPQEDSLVSSPAQDKQGKKPQEDSLVSSPAQDKEGKKPQEDSLVSSPAQDKEGKKPQEDSLVSSPARKPTTESEKEKEKLEEKDEESEEEESEEEESEEEEEESEEEESEKEDEEEKDEEEETDAQSVAPPVATLVQDTPITSDPVISPTDGPPPENEAAPAPPTAQETPATLAEDDTEAANPAPSETPSPAPTETPPPATLPPEVDQTPVVTETSGEQTSSG